MTQQTEPPHGRATPLDRTFQLVYVCAYQAMRVYWRLKRPETHGALVTIWNEGEVLLVRNSYVSYYSVPGGYVNTGENAVEAAVRELGEEIGFRANREDLVPIVDVTHDWEGKRDHVEIFSLDVATRPKIQIDRREVIGADWYTRERALGLNLFPPLRTAIEKRPPR